MLLVGWQLWQLSAQPEGRRLRLAARGAPRAAVRAGRGAAGRARLRGVGAVPRPQHRELVRRARRPRARGRPQSRPQRARLPAQGDGQQGEPDRAHARRSRRRAACRRALNRAAEQAGVYEAALFSSTGGVLAVAGIGGSTRAAGAAAGAGAAARAAAADRTRRSSSAPTAACVLRVVVPVNSDDRLEPLKVLQVIEPVPKALAQDVEKVQAGVARLPGDLVLAAGAEAALRADADADAAARAHLGARPRGRAVRALRGAARAARRGHARGRAGRFHAPPAGDLARRARRAHRIVQHDDGAARRGAAEDRGVAPRDRDDARVPREHPRQPVGRRARVRRAATGCARPMRAPR